MKVLFKHKVPQFMIYKGFEGKVQDGDILEMDEKTYSEFANLDLEIIEEENIEENQEG